MSALASCLRQAESDAITFAAEAETFHARGKYIIAHHYRRMARRRAEQADALRAQINSPGLVTLEASDDRHKVGSESVCAVAVVVGPAAPSGAAGLANGRGEPRGDNLP